MFRFGPVKVRCPYRGLTKCPIRVGFRLHFTAKRQTTSADYGNLCATVTESRDHHRLLLITQNHREFKIAERSPFVFGIFDGMTTGSRLNLILI